MSLKDRRNEYSWSETRVSAVELMTDKKSYSRDEPIKAVVAFRIVGGLREAFHPDVWTVSWEDFDKILRLHYVLSVSAQRGPIARKLAETEKQVRKASFYWSRDPDLPYRIWAMIIPEDGGPPKIPTGVEDAKMKMLDVSKAFEIPAARLSPGRHKLRGEVNVKWGRRSFIEKGAISSKSKQVAIEIE